VTTIVLNEIEEKLKAANELPSLAKRIKEGLGVVLKFILPALPNY